MKLLGTISHDKDIINKDYGDTNYQELLVSGVNIKTINNIDILGDGNIDVGGGGGGAVNDVTVNGTSVLSQGVAAITLKTINGTPITGTGDLAVEEVYIGSTTPTNPSIDVWIDPNGTSVFVPTNYYGTTIPSNSLGEDGDLYIMIE